MIFFEHILLITTIVTAVIGGIVGIGLLSKPAPYKILGAILSINAIWAALSFMLIFKTFTVLPVFLLGLQTLSLSIISILWLDFVISYANIKKQWYTPLFKFSYLILVFFAISLLGYNSNNGLSNGFTKIIEIAWLISSILQLSILLPSTFLFHKTLAKQTHLSKYQFRALLTSIYLPSLAIIAYFLIGFNTLVHRDYHSLSLVFFFSSLSLIIALFRNKLIESLPNTYHGLFSSNNNPIVLLDKQANIINYNSAAKIFFDELPKPAIGQDIYKIIPSLPSKEEHFKDIAVNIFSYDLDELNIYADISFYPVKPMGLKINAYLLEIKDVSSHVLDYKQIERLSEFQQALISLANQTGAKSISNSFYQLVLEHAVKLIPDADMGSVVLKSKDGKFKYQAAVGFPLDSVENISYTKEQVFFGEFNQNTKALVKRHSESLEESHIDKEQFKLLKKALPLIEKIKATLAIPIFLEGDLVAIFSLDSFQSSHAFDIDAQRLSEIFSQKITDFVQRSHLQTKLIKEANLKFAYAQFEQKLAKQNLSVKSSARIAKIILETENLSVEKISILEITDKAKTKVVNYFRHNGKLQKEYTTISGETKDVILELLSNKSNSYIEDFDLKYQLGKSLFISLITENTNSSYLAIASSQIPYAFDLEERNFLANSANHLKLLIEKQKVDSKLEQLAIFRQSIVDISDKFLDGSIDTEFYQELLKKAIEIIPIIDKGSVLLLKDDNRFHFETSYGFDITALQKISFAIEDFPFDYSLPKSSFIVRNLEKIQLAGLNTEQLEIRRKYGKIEEIKATLYIPIKISGFLQGFFCLDSTSSYDFEESSLEMAQILGRQVANMLQRTQILNQAQEQAKNYEKLFKTSERQRQKLYILNEIIKYTAQETNIKNLLQKTVDIIAATLKNNFVAIIIFEQNKVNIFHPTNYNISPLIKENISKGLGIIPEVARTGVDVFLPDTSNSAIYVGDGESEICSEIAVAIKIDEEVIGVLNIEHVKELDDTYFELAHSLAEQLSISLARAKLFKQVNESELQLKLLAENTKDVISLHALDGTRLYISPSVKDVLGYSPEEIIEENYIDKTHPDDIESLKIYWHQLIKDNQKTPHNGNANQKPLIYRKQHKNGQYVWLESLGNFVYDENDNMVAYVASTRNISERVKLEESLKQQALYDELTDLANRRLFLDRVDQNIKRNLSNKNTFAILFFDLDRFKLVNDSYGHYVGDKLLIEIANRLKMVLRETDTAARLGGDEFCVLIENIGSKSQALDISNTVQTAINQPFIYDGREINISTSFGLAFNELSYKNANDLLRDADIAMYEAKQQNSENKLSIFNPAMHDKIVERLQIDSDLRQAIDKDELRLEFQPIFNISNKEVIGFESLLRWYHTDKQKLISPEIFIPISEETAYITEIDIWVLRNSCKQLVNWRKKYNLKNLSVSVNVSAKTFEMKDFIDTLRLIIQETGIYNHELKLELTERTIMENPNRGIQILDSLQEKGIAIHIDDFGTGYSSLSYLNKIKFDVLKIDRSFISMIGQKEDQALVETIIALAKLRNLAIIAEGIETQEQLETLKALGCEYGQGWLFSKSLEPAQIEEKYFIKKLTTA